MPGEGIQKGIVKSLKETCKINKHQSKQLLIELSHYMDDADWFTIGIMAPSANIAIFTLKEMETCFNWPAMLVVEKPSEQGPVFLKANQNTGDIYIRTEINLGEGILLTCQNYQENK